MELIGPSGNSLAGMSQAREQRLVQQLVPHPAVEALGVAILLRLARGDVVPVDPGLARPRQHRIGRQFGARVSFADMPPADRFAIVADDRHRLAPPDDEGGKLTRHPLARNRRVYDRRQVPQRRIRMTSKGATSFTQSSLESHRVTIKIPLREQSAG